MADNAREVDPAVIAELERRDLEAEIEGELTHEEVWSDLRARLKTLSESAQSRGNHA